MNTMCVQLRKAYIKFGLQFIFLISQDLAKFLAEKCQDGFIYINFGTMVDFYKAPDIVITKFFDALRNVNIPILWKWGSKAMPANAPENVFFASWIPQNSVLSKFNFIGLQ